MLHRHDCNLFSFNESELLLIKDFQQKTFWEKMSSQANFVMFMNSVVIRITETDTLHFLCMTWIVLWCFSRSLKHREVRKVCFQSQTWIIQVPGWNLTEITLKMPLITCLLAILQRYLYEMLNGSNGSFINQPDCQFVLYVCAQVPAGAAGASVRGGQDCPMSDTADSSWLQWAYYKARLGPTANMAAP